MIGGIDIIKFPMNVLLKMFAGSKNFSSRHKGEACYIFGDGPSTKNMDLSAFGDLISISCGKLIFRHDFDRLNCNYYVIPEPFLFAHNVLKRHQYLRDDALVANFLRKKILSESQINFFVNGSNLFSVRGKNINYIHRYLFNPVKGHSRIDPYGGSFFACLTLAYLMGFTKIFLVGFDSWTLRRSSDIRWFEYGTKSTNSNGEVLNNDLIDFYKGEMEIKSIVIDRKQALNFEGISYLEHTGLVPQYKENFELTNGNVLQVLSTQPAYKIFNVE